jgi:hypothetical protein
MDLRLLSTFFPTTRRKPIWVWCYGSKDIAFFQFESKKIPYMQRRTAWSWGYEDHREARGAQGGGTRPSVGEERAELVKRETREVGSAHSLYKLHLVVF